MVLDPATPFTSTHRGVGASRTPWPKILSTAYEHLKVPEIDLLALN